MKDCSLEAAFFKETIHQMGAPKIDIGEVAPNECRVACYGMTQVTFGKITILKPLSHPGVFQIYFSKRTVVELTRHKRSAKFHSIKATMRKSG